MRLSFSTIGCGCLEVQGLSIFKTGNEDTKIETFIICFRPCNGKPTANLILFGDGVSNQWGQSFANFLTDNKLGRVVSSDIVSSPIHTEANHKGYQIWLWYVDRQALSAFYEKHNSKVSSKDHRLFGISSIGAPECFVKKDEVEPVNTQIQQTVYLL